MDEEDTKKFAKLMEAVVVVNSAMTGNLPLDNLNPKAAYEHVIEIDHNQTPQELVKEVGIKNMESLDKNNEQVTETPSNNLTPQQDLNKIAETLDKKDKVLEDASEVFKTINEHTNTSQPAKDAAKEWDKDIKEREAIIIEKRENQLQTLEQNKVMQESQLKDAKKEGYEEKLVELDKVTNKEKNEINNKFEKEMREIDKEKAALQNAIEQKQDIEKKRKDFEQQRVLERQKQITLIAK